jgi:PAS domain S-box-containing protein
MNPPNLNQLFDLEYFFELSPDLLCIAGYDGYFKKINPAVSKTLGYSNEELFAKPINHFVYSDDKDITSRKRESIKKDIPLLNFENRYVTKSGDIIWLTWTSMPVNTQKVVFAIAKNITYKKKLEEYRRISGILAGKVLKGISADGSLIVKVEDHIEQVKSFTDHNLSPIDQAWLNDFESLVRKYAGKIDLNIGIVSAEMAISERQLFRRINNLIGITPNKFIRVVRLQVAKELIATGKYKTIAEVAYASGFVTPSYFSKLFREIYDEEAGNLIS